MEERLTDQTQLEAERLRLHEAERRQRILSEISAILLDYVGGGEAEYRLLKDIGLASAIVAPLVTGAEPLGTLILASAGAGGRKYTPNDVDFVVALADRASLAVRNARLVRELAEERDREQFAREGAERRAAELLATFEADPNGLVLFDQYDRVRYVGS